MSSSHTHTHHHAVAVTPGPSLLRFSAGQRLAIVSLVVGLLWLAVAATLGWF